MARYSPPPEFGLCAAAAVMSRPPATALWLGRSRVTRARLSPAWLFWLLAAWAGAVLCVGVRLPTPTSWGAANAGLALVVGQNGAPLTSHLRGVRNSVYPGGAKWGGLSW
jgi:hypothetical protein